MEDPQKRFGELIETLAASRPGELDVPITEMDGLARGALLDNATELLRPRGYVLFKVRVEDASWIASYRLGRRVGGN
jgi:hypothetical protein